MLKYQSDYVNMEVSPHRRKGEDLNIRLAQFDRVLLQVGHKRPSTTRNKEISAESDNGDGANGKGQKRSNTSTTTTRRRGRSSGALEALMLSPQVKKHSVSMRSVTSSAATISKAGSKNRSGLASLLALSGKQKSASHLDEMTYASPLKSASQTSTKLSTLWSHAMDQQNSNRQQQPRARVAGDRRNDRKLLSQSMHAADQNDRPTPSLGSFTSPSTPAVVNSSEFILVIRAK